LNALLELSSGAAVDNPTKSGHTAVELAAMRGRLSTVCQLRGRWAAADTPRLAVYLAVYGFALDQCNVSTVGRRNHADSGGGGGAGSDGSSGGGASTVGGGDNRKDGTVGNGDSNGAAEPHATAARGASQASAATDGRNVADAVAAEPTGLDGARLDAAATATVSAPCATLLKRVREVGPDITPDRFFFEFYMSGQVNRPFSRCLVSAIEPSFFDEETLRESINSSSEGTIRFLVRRAPRCRLIAFPHPIPTPEQ
jgi:hypothetical protein